MSLSTLPIKFWLLIATVSAWSFQGQDLREAVHAWCDGDTQMDGMGHIGTWNVSRVTNMSRLFEGPGPVFGKLLLGVGSGHRFRVFKA